MNKKDYNFIRAFQREILFENDEIKFGKKLNNAVVYIGNVSSANKENVEKIGYTHILRCMDTPKKEQKFTKEIKKISLEGFTEDSPDIKDYIKKSIEFFDNAMKEELPSILIHCFSGMMRSGAIAIAILMHRTGLTYKQALSVIRKDRLIDPNKNLEKQITNYKQFNTSGDLIVTWGPYPYSAELPQKIDTEYDVKDILTGEVKKITINTGDLLLEGGGEMIGDKMTQLFTKKIYTHVMLAYGNMLTESLNKNHALPDKISNKKKDGIQMLNMYQRFYVSTKNLYIKQITDLNGNPTGLKDYDKKIVWDTYVDYHDSGFEKSPFSFYNTVIRFYQPLESNYISKKKKNFICSEWVAFLYQKLGLINKKAIVAYYTPGDLSILEFPKDSQYKLGKMYQILGFPIKN